MKLRRRADAPATEDRAELKERTATGATPGQKLVGATAAVLAVVIVLGGVYYNFVYVPGQQAQATKVAGEQQTKAKADQAPPSAPSLDVPAFAMGGQDMSQSPPPLPPGMDGGTMPGTLPGGQAPKADSSKEAALKAELEQMRERQRLQDEARQKEEDGKILQRKLASKMMDEPTGVQRANAQGGSYQSSDGGGATPAGATRLSGGGAAVGANDFSGRLIPTSTPKVSASYIPNPSFTVKKGTPIRCTMDTAMSSDEPGFVSCTVAKPVYGMDGRVVLIDRGSTVDGELAKGPDRGKKRAAVLWGRIVSPYNITIDVNSPGTDTLGASGLTGSIDNHYCERFCGAFLFSTFQDLIQGGIQAATSKGSGNTNIVLPQNTLNNGQTAVGEMLQQGRNVVPTFSKNQGDEITITVARDLDFSTAYQLKEVQQ